MSKICVSYLLLFCMFSFAPDCAGQSCIINGSFTSSTSEKKIVLEGGKISKVIDIGPDGRFSAEFELESPTSTLIHTENGSSWILWLDSGNIDIILHEQIYSGKSGVQRMLSIRSIKGPVDTEAREYFIKRSNQLISKYESKDSISFYLAPEIESFIRARPSSGLTPQLLSDMSQNLGVIQGNRLLQLASDLNSEQIDTTSWNKLYVAFERLSRLQPGMRFPPFRVLGIDGKFHDFNEINSDYIAVHFWASWCAPCRASASDIKSLLEKTSKARLQMVHVSLDQDSVAWREAIRHDGLPGLHLSELSGFRSSLTSSLYVDAIPFIVLLNRKGEVVEADISIARLEALIAKGRIE
jgi:thiol-disulfide isomerase/thioredoxin